MASQSFNNLENTWDAAKRYTAPATPTDILLSNPSDNFLFFDTTPDNTEPTASPRRAHPLGPKSSRPMTLNANERLWLAGDGAYALVGV